MEILHRLFDRVTEPDRPGATEAKRFGLAVVNYCADAHASVTSWYRTAKRNKRVGGRPTSRHLKGLAVDVVYDERMSLKERTLIAEKHGLIILVENDHDHITMKH